ncbi:EAL domain-containing protein [Alginatibacterium sediminis]|uniref:EAL domain-containing protein n=2 Tax=Alginatibacterium sediminis TaxID=2164068 RepID=A0A420E756_9ALTE|nr:EAL domain-containing protein [Alginatibacterium sediminis]
MVRLVTAAFVISLLIIVLLIEVIRRGNKNRTILEENEARYRDLAHAGANIFWEMDPNNRFSYMSGDSSLFYGTEISNILGKTLDQLCKRNPRIDFEWGKYESALAAQKPLNNFILKVRLPTKDINIFVINGKAIFDKLGAFQGYRGISKNITHEHLLSQKLAYQANYDELTGLINRYSFNSRLKAHVEQDSRSGSCYICFLDLDRFKLVNDTAGHLVGDAMLAEIAQLIEKTIGEHGVLGRLGGDEFGLIILDQSQAQAQSLCEEIIEEINAYRFHWNQRLFNVGISIGMVPVTGELSVTELLSKADLCCYRAKDLGRGRVYIANLDSDDLYDEQLQMGYIANVAQAIEQNQFYLVKQLIKSSDSMHKNQSHYEMLIRYRDEQGKIIAPGLFIPAAEKHSVITLIDQWVLSTVLNRYDDFFPQGNTQVSINLSGMSLSNENFVSEVKRLLTQSTVSPELICFEITETAAISQLGKAQEFISEMKSLGIKFAIDDFGSGASSFGYLKNLPVDYLKIDGSLIRNIVSDSSDRAIVEAIHSIAKMMSMKTVAEFVENDDIIKVLQEIGVDYLQGYGIEKPQACE